MKLISGCVIYTHTYNWRVCISSLRGADTIFGQLKSGKKNYKGDGRAPIVKLGDASMASPFTAKHASVAPTTDIIRQGRSTLVTTLQMFKILGLNCLATAYVLSVMYLDGVKLGDIQATISGIFTAAFFLFISHARPLPTLSAERPHPNIFCAYVFLSLLGPIFNLCLLIDWLVHNYS